MRIALDAHGGDIGTSRNVEAAIAAGSDPRFSVVLVGRTDEIQAELRRQGAHPDAFEIVHAGEDIGMGEAAARSVRRKTDNSITVALGQMKQGNVDAVVSAGHSGAVVAAAMMTLGRLRGVSRPALGTLIPALNSKKSFTLDIGAMVDPRPDVMLQYAYLGLAYSRSVLGVEAPQVALLSNGEESSKGNTLVRTTQDLFIAANLPYIGFVEGGDLLDAPPDVTVMDGFTGNVATKVAEGTATMIHQALKRELTANWRDKVLAALLKPAFKRMQASMDFEGIGGAAVLGIDGIVVVAHGRSSVRALCSSLQTAYMSAQARLPRLLEDAIPESQPSTTGNGVIPPVKIS